MAQQKRSKGRSRPPKKRIRYVDGFAIRNIFPDMDVVESHSTSGGRKNDIPTPFIPKDEIWIDRRFRREKAFLIEVHRLEQLKRFWPESKTRAYIKERMLRKGSPPPFVVRSRRRGRLMLRYVRGEIVRRYFDPEFIFGGHDLIYDYIPEKEVWIDIRQDPREIPYTILHETHERELMRRGASYDKAHRSATAAELVIRRRETAKKRPRPLRLMKYMQRAGYCGPASLKIMLAYFGREYDELYLGQLCGTTDEEGTDHAGLVKAAETLGAKVFTSDGGTIAQLRRFVRKHRLPVLVGWYSPSNIRKTKFDPEVDEVEDHFSIVYHVGSTHVCLRDPDEESGRRRMPISKFLKLWWDTDGPEDERVLRWFMVLHFDGRTFK